MKCVLSAAFLVLLLTSPIPPALSQSTSGGRQYFREYTLPQPHSRPLAIAVDSEGKVWFSENNISRIAVLNPTTGKISQYQIPSRNMSTDIFSIAIHPDGGIWFTDATNNLVRRLDPGSGNVQDFQIPSENSVPIDVTFDREGNLWFAESGTGRIAELVFSEIGKGISPIREFTPPISNSGPIWMDFDKGGKIWFSQAFVNYIGSFDPITENFEEHKLPTSARGPLGVAFDLNGKLWYAQERSSTLGRLDPTDGSVKEFATATYVTTTYGIVRDKVGNIWVAENRANRLAKVSPSSLSIIEYQIPTDNALTSLLDVGPDGNVWFTETLANKVGFLNASMPLPFQLDPSQRSLAVPQGSTGRVTVTVNAVVARQLVLLARGSMTVSGRVGSLANLTVGSAPSNFSLEAGQAASSTFEISPNFGLKPGIYSMTLGVTDGPITSAVIIDLQVSAGFRVPSLQAIVVAVTAITAIVFVGIWIARRRKARGVSEM